MIGPMRVVVDIVLAKPDPAELCKELHSMLREKFAKAEFAATMFERISVGDKVNCPAYITDALVWLDKELVPSKKGAV